MSRQESPFERGYQAGFKAGWHARETKAVEAMAEMVLLVKPSDIEAAEQRIAKRAQRSAGDERPDYPGAGPMEALTLHRSEAHELGFDACNYRACVTVSPAVARDAVRYSQWLARQ